MIYHENTERKYDIKLLFIYLQPKYKYNIMEYLERMADSQIQERLNAFGAVLIEGPKWCGKTTSAEHIAASVIKLQDTEMRAQYIATAATNPHFCFGAPRHV